MSYLMSLVTFASLAVMLYLCFHFGCFLCFYVAFVVPFTLAVYNVSVFSLGVFWCFAVEVLLEIPSFHW